MTNLLLLIGAGLFSKCVGAFERHRFNSLLGADIDDAGGDGPGSYDVRGNVWHLNCCNPDNTDSPGWGVFSSIFGWSNNGSSKWLPNVIISVRGTYCIFRSVGTVLAYIFYWLAVIVVLIIMKFKEVNLPIHPSTNYY